ncbi:MAG: hypothetical protein JEY71_07420 [Sphaerochaeta sp.]|nr:hypothetical protein [Sphaerochaeta sp.]
MRKLLFVYLLALLCSLPATSNLALAMFPQEKHYALSFDQHGQTSFFSGQLSFSGSDEQLIMLPPRFKIVFGGSSVSLGYAGFWQGYALLPLFLREQGLLYQIKEQAFALVLGKNEKWAIGYEHTLKRGKLSALAWIQRGQEASSFQTEWGAQHSRWAVAGKVFLESSTLALRSELLFTPVKGLEVFFSSSCTYGSSKVSFAYGEDSYPSRYSIFLNLQSKTVQASFVMEDWFGPKPTYGGFSTMRKRKQSSEVKIFLRTGYLGFFFSDTYEFKSRGTEVGSVILQATWKGSFFQMSARYGVIRDSLIDMKGLYTFSMVLYKATLSYTEAGYEITLSDSVAMGKGIGTWSLKKSEGKGVSLSLLYALTSGQ